ncbi:MAG TPA: hypothetical protein DDW49_00655 [Deltaproteobacteria bacterium]|nr:MAG: hypothetical protein A2048_06425 [Deltaproteobacteria bacterium GWA2_45_12]HBF11893.1 hypothetical protein [Deltaproteobacteria bacterium]
MKPNKNNNFGATCSSNPACKIAVDGSQSKPEYCVYTDRNQAGTNKIYYYYETGFVVLNPSP